MKNRKKRVSIRGVLADLFLTVLVISLIFGFSLYAKQFFGAYHEKVEIDLSLWQLPKYTFFSLCRGLSAYVLSLFFSLIWGIWVAKDRLAEKIVLPLLDVLQSIPFLGFLPGAVLIFINLFKTTNIGLELAAILIMFTSQVWNMAFSVYQSIRTVPAEKNEAATAYGFSSWQRLKWVEFPFAILSLSWNSILSMAGCWFLLMVNEAFKLGTRDFQLPGLGSYMSVATAQNELTAIVGAIIAMLALIILLDQFIWRPLISWSQKFRIEETASSTVTTTWFLNILKNSYLLNLTCSYFKKIGQKIQDFQAKNPSKNHKNKIPLIISRICLIALFSLLIIGAVYITQLVSVVPFYQWKHLSYLFSLTFWRVLLCLVIGLLIAIPIGLFIGLSEKNLRFLMPFIQIGASFPATLLFPIVIVIMNWLEIPLAIGSAVLMLMGSFWYLFLNVIGGAKAMPSDLREVATHFQFSIRQKFFWLYLPAISPYLVVGVMTAAGGAWNASIVAEYVQHKNRILTTPGIGSSIELAAQNNDMALLGASIIILSTFVVLLNYFVFLKLYRYTENKFAINY